MRLEEISSRAGKINSFSVRKSSLRLLYLVSVNICFKSKRFPSISRKLWIEEIHWNDECRWINWETSQHKRFLNSQRPNHRFFYYLSSSNVYEENYSTYVIHIHPDEIHELKASYEEHLKNYLFFFRDFSGFSFCVHFCAILVIYFYEEIYRYNSCEKKKC